MPVLLERPAREEEKGFYERGEGVTLHRESGIPLKSKSLASKEKLGGGGCN